MGNDWIFKVWETKHEQEFLGEMSARELINLLHNRPLTDTEFCDAVNTICAMSAADVGCETVYIRADWTIDVERTK